MWLHFDAQLTMEWQFSNFLGIGDGQNQKVLKFSILKYVTLSQ